MRTGSKWYVNGLISLDWENVLADVGSFLEPGFDMGLLTKENLVQVLG